MNYISIFKKKASEKDPDPSNLQGKENFRKTMGWTLGQVYMGRGTVPQFSHDGNAIWRTCVGLGKWSTVGHMSVVPNTPFSLTILHFSTHWVTMKYTFPLFLLRIIETEAQW